ncbi:hypothetical protein M422DRAFT_23545 [Sphaerobolus stellatus SS14]|nr:hypothetical protein M422DRAFT_23545 [Sphaerobolus stellatus SS14]
MMASLDLGLETRNQQDVVPFNPFNVPFNRYYANTSMYNGMDNPNHDQKKVFGDPTNDYWYFNFQLPGGPLPRMPTMADQVNRSQDPSTFNPRKKSSCTLLKPLEDGKFQCTNCRTKFGTPGDAKKHVIRKMALVACIYAPICDKSFGRAHLARKHSERCKHGKDGHAMGTRV